MDKIKLMNEMVKELTYDFPIYDDCGDVNYTLLAENMADKFDLYEDNVDYVIPEWVFDIAVNAGEKYKKQNKPTVKMHSVRPNR